MWLIIVIIITPTLLLVLGHGYILYREGKSDGVGQDYWMSTPIQIGGNPLFWFWDKFYAAGWYAAARKGE